MNAKSAGELGTTLAFLVGKGKVEEAYEILAPVLAERTPFRLLDRIGAAVGARQVSAVPAFLDRIASERTEGGWVIIASTLGQRLNSDLPGALGRARAYAIEADIWYAADILAERVPGPAMVNHFERSLPLLEPWRQDASRWVRRMLGVATHFWAKRSRGALELSGCANALLAFLEPMFTEWDMDAVKGVGWGLKTLGRTYPHLVGPWLEEQVIRRGRRHRTLMLHKATTYVPDVQRASLMGEL